MKMGIPSTNKLQSRRREVFKSMIRNVSFMGIVVDICGTRAKKGGTEK